MKEEPLAIFMRFQRYFDAIAVKLHTVYSTHKQPRQLVI